MWLPRKKNFRQTDMWLLRTSLAKAWPRPAGRQTAHTNFFPLFSETSGRYRSRLSLSHKYFDVFWSTIVGHFELSCIKIKVIFWNPEAKLDKIGMLQNDFFFVLRFNLIWPDIDLTLISSWVRRKNECFRRILRQKCPIKHVSQRHSNNISVWLNRWGYN